MPRCELCQREEIQVTRHHLIPRAMHRKPRTARTFEPDDLNGRIALLCRPCHKFVHTVLGEKELASGYTTVESLRAHPEIAKFVRWISNKPPGLRVPSFKKWS